MYNGGDSSSRRTFYKASITALKSRINHQHLIRRVKIVTSFVANCDTRISKGSSDICFCYHPTLSRIPASAQGCLAAIAIPLPLQACGKISITPGAQSQTQTTSILFLVS
jgi:hypothetical protein